MHSLRLQIQNFKFCKQFTSSLSKNVKLNTRAFCSVKTTLESDLADMEQFKAAVLHPKNVNLNVETLVLPNAISDNLVRSFTIRKCKFSSFKIVIGIIFFFQVRIGIDYCALNACDVRCIREEINSVMLPFIPGSEYSGKILELGPNCKKDFKVGDKVTVLSSISIIHLPFY